MSSLLQNKLYNVLFVVISLGFFAGGVLWSDNAYAHKGHAGKKVTFLKKKVVLKAMLPAEGKVYRRKQRLDSDQAEWAEKTYGVELKHQVYPFYVSKIRNTKTQIGAAIIHKFTYRHGNGEVAVGLDKDNKVSKVAFVSVNEKYLVDFEDTVGTGFIDTYDGMSVEDLVENAKQKQSADKATREFAKALRDAAVILVAFEKR